MNTEKTKILSVTTGGGATSCVSVRLHDACLFFNKNQNWPDKIDSSSQFQIFQQNQKIDFSKFVFGKYVKPNEIDFINFDHGYQFMWYDKLDMVKISLLANKVCPMSDQIINKSIEFSNLIIDRGAVLYRGNDKQLEVPRTEYNTMLDMGLKSGFKSWIVQTDEIEFFDFWVKNFPDSIRFTELPIIKSNLNSYIMAENRIEFLTNFLAALKAISMAPVLLTTTGNTGLWTLIFRGNCQNVYQAWGDNLIWKKY